MSCILANIVQLVPDPSIAAINTAQFSPNTDVRHCYFKTAQLGYGICSRHCISYPSSAPTLALDTASCQSRQYSPIQSSPIP
jgi:hypothetical protein